MEQGAVPLELVVASPFRVVVAVVLRMGMTDLLVVEVAMVDPLERMGELMDTTMHPTVETMVEEPVQETGVVALEVEDMCG
jgi:hypothetical protein